MTEHEELFTRVWSLIAARVKEVRAAVGENEFENALPQRICISLMLYDSDAVEWVYSPAVDERVLKTVEQLLVRDLAPYKMMDQLSRAMRKLAPYDTETSWRVK